MRSTIRCHTPAILGLTLVFGVFPVAGDESTTCTTVQECLECARGVAAGGLGISKDEQEVATALQEFGEEAVSGVVAFLTDEDPGVRQLGAFILRDIDGLQEEHLPVLISAWEGKEGWIPPAIASIGTEAAIQYLVSQLSGEWGTHPQLVWAFRRLGANAVPFLIEGLKKAKPDDDRLFDGLQPVFAELSEEASTGIEDLEKIASNPSYPNGVRVAAVQCLGSIGPPAASSAPLILQLEQREPDVFDGKTGLTLKRMGDSSMALRILEHLADYESAFEKSLGLRALAELGPGGKPAGPGVEDLLNGDDVFLRVAAARALGVVGYRESIGSLRRALFDRRDWRLAWVAARSLWQLQAEESVEDLREVSTQHWYPPVREMASVAAEAIAQKQWLPDPEPNTNMSIYFYDWLFVAEDIDRCDEVEVVIDDEVLSLTVSDFDQPQIGDQLPNELFAGEDPSQSDEARDPESETGRIMSFQVPGGWLVAHDKGEWGGQLFFTGSGLDREVILDKPAFAIYQLPSGVFALANTESWAFGEAAVFAVSPDPTGRWAAELLVVLPTRLTGSAPVGQDAVVIATNGGAVLFTGGENLTLVACSGKSDG